MDNPTFLSKIEESVSKNLKLPLELETKFRLFNDHIPTNHQTANRLISYLNEYGKIVTLSSYKVEIMNLGDEETVRRLLNEDDTLIRMEKKKRIIKEIDNEYAINTTLSIEEPFKMGKEKFVPTITRKIKRYSFDYSDTSIFDISEVTQNNEPTRYEFELELKPNLFEKKNISKIMNIYKNEIKEVFLMVMDTRIAYQKTEYLRQFREFNKILSYPEQTFMNESALYKARDLNFKDLEGRAFLGNRIRVTFKTDGYRKALFYNKEGLWLLYRNSLNLISRDPNPSRYTIILDGELVPYNKMNPKAAIKINEKYYFVAFDALVIDGVDIRRMTHKERISRINENILKNYEGFRMDIKPFWDFNTADDFFELMRKLEDKEKPKLSYMEDGYIFVSNEMKYNSGVDKCAPHLRILTLKPDMCKWKPIDKLTIDFSVKIIRKSELANETFLELRVNSKAGRLVKFPPVGVQIISHNKSEIKNLKDGAIYEFVYDKNEKTFYPVRERIDRASPNGIEEAMSVWRRIEDPISINDLRGESTRLMRKYHNVVKRSLYSKGSGYLLDIGVGYGGTITSWKDPNYKKIVAVEPDFSHIEQLQVRLNNQGLSWQLMTKESDPETILALCKVTDTKVLILATGGEDWPFIRTNMRKFFAMDAGVSEDKAPLADVVASMFSMTFFWKSDTMLANFTATIKNCLRQGGTFIFTVMDGSSIVNIFEPKLTQSGAPPDNKIIAKNFEIKYTGPLKGQKFFILLRDSIVGDDQKPQREYICYPEEFYHARFDGVRISRFDQEPFMSREERFLSKLYIYGICPNFHTEGLRPEDRNLMSEEDEAILEELEEFKRTGRIIPPPPTKLEEVDFDDDVVKVKGKRPKVEHKPEEETEEEEIPVQAPTIKTFAINQANLSKGKVVPLIIESKDNENISKVEDGFVRITAKGPYDALLKAFYPDYAEEQNSETRQKILNEFSEYFGEIYIPTIANALDINIIVIKIENHNKIILSEVSIPLSSKRPFIILSKIIYQDKVYYELIGVIENKGGEKRPKLYYRTVFSNKQTIVETVMDLDREVLLGAYKWPVTIQSADFDNITSLPNVTDPKRITFGNYAQVEDKRAAFEYLSQKLVKKAAKKIYGSFGDREDQIAEIVNELDEIASIGYYCNDENNISSFLSDKEIYLNPKKKPSSLDLLIYCHDQLTPKNLLRGLKILSTGGSLICEIEDIDNTIFFTLVYLLTYGFSTVSIVKPASTAPYVASGKYILAQGLGENKERLLEIINMADNAYVPLSFIRNDNQFIFSLSYIIDQLNSSEMQSMEEIVRNLSDGGA